MTGVWLLDVPPHMNSDGKRLRLSFPDKAAAVQEANLRVRAARIDLRVGKVTDKQPVGITFSELSERWLEYQAGRVAIGKKRASSLETTSYQLKALFQTFEMIDVARINHNTIMDYQRKRLNVDKRKPATVNSEVATLSSILSWAVDKEIINRAPKYEYLSVDVVDPYIPTREEVLRIIQELEGRTGLLIRFLAETGCRKDEALSLTWSDLNAGESLIKIRRKKGFSPKNRHSQRNICISDGLNAQLMLARSNDFCLVKAKENFDDHYIFPGRFGGKRTDCRKALATAIKKAGVKHNGSPVHLTMHVFRKAMATWLHRDNVSDRVLQARLGHAPGSRITHKTYVKVTSEDEKKAVFDLTSSAI